MSSSTQRVLVVTYYWPPSGGAGVQRILKFCKYLPQFDIEPIVLTVSNPTYPIRDESLSKEIPVGLSVHRSWSLEPYQLYAQLSGRSTNEIAKPTTDLSGQSLVQKLATWIRGNLFLPDARAGWLLTAREKALRLVKQYHVDAVLTTGPPHSAHFVGRYVQQQEQLPWIADLRDPWAEIHYNQLLPRSDWAQHIDEHLEGQVLKRADAAVVVSPGMAELFRPKVDRDYPVITNGFDPADFPPTNPTPKFSKQPVIRHVGSISEGSVPVGLLDAFRQLPPHHRPQLEFIGNTHHRVQQLVDRWGLTEWVHFKTYVPHQEAITQMRTADVLLLSIPEVAHNELIVTGKLFDYLGAQRSILCLGPGQGDAAQIIEECKAGITLGHHDADALQNTLRDIATGQFSAHYIPDASDVQAYSRVTLTQKLASVISSTW
jgi:glycosyltransferase involved in cell wall biosynthesis